jgi:hypothetical protein
MKRANVCGPVLVDASELVVGCKVGTEATVEVPSLSDVNGIPISVLRKLAENVDATPNVVSGANRVELKLVECSASATPLNGNVVRLW